METRNLQQLGLKRVGNSYSPAPRPAPSQPTLTPSQPPILKPVSAGQPRPKQNLIDEPMPTEWSQPMGYKDGGPVKNKPNLAAKKGPVTGPGTSTSDSIPAKLSKGEFIIPAHIVKQYGKAFFNKLIGGAKEPDTDDKGRPMLSQGGSLSEEEKRKALAGNAAVPGLTTAQQLAPMVAGFMQPRANRGTSQVSQAAAMPALAQPQPQRSTLDATQQWTAAPAANITPANGGKTITQMQALDNEQALTIPNLQASQQIPTGDGGFKSGYDATQVINKPARTTQATTARSGQGVPMGADTRTNVIPASTEYRNDLGGGNYIGDGKTRTQDSVDRMRALMTPSTDAEKQSRADNTAIADSNWDKSKAWDANQRTLQQQTQQDQQIQQANNTLLAPAIEHDLTGGWAQQKNKAAASEFLGRTNDRQQNQLGRQRLDQQAGQDAYTMGRQERLDQGASEQQGIDNTLAQAKFDWEKSKPGKAPDTRVQAEFDPLTKEKNGETTWQFNPDTKAWDNITQGVKSSDQAITAEEYAHPVVKASAKQAYDYALAHPDETPSPRIAALVVAYLENNQVKK